MKAVLVIGMLVLVLGGALPALAQGNLTDGCVESYDPTVNYFPDQVQVRYSERFEVEYFNHYKVVRVREPWPGASETDVFEYVLVQCGTPVPDGYDAVQVIEVPAQRIITMSTIELPQLKALGLLDRLIGMENFLYTNTPEVREMIDAGKLIEIGEFSGINLEVVLDAEPDLVMTHAFGLADYDAHPVLLDAGIFVALDSSWVETSPLGRAEWIKYMALFFNKEAAANATFEPIAAEYERLTTLTAAIAPGDRPLVLPDSFSSYNDAWNMPGGESYMARLIHDAGGRMVMEDAPEVKGEVGSVLFGFEAVYEAGLDADIWLPVAFNIQTLDDLVALDERYADFAAVQNGGVYNNDARVNENGGNDYYESGAANPQIVLADFIRMLHPDLLPDHELYYYRLME